MPNVRRLAYRDAFVWSLVQTISGGSSALPPVQFQPGVPTEFIVSLTQEEWNEVFSALLTGADLTYPDKSHEVVWHLLKQVEYPIAPEVNMLMLDAFCCNGATVSGGTLTYTAAPALPFGYTMFSDTTASRYIESPVWLNAGDYAYTGWYSKNNSAGNARIQLYKGGVFIGNLITGIDQYAAAFGARFSATTTFTVFSDDFYELRAGNDGTKHAASSAFSVNWCSSSF